MRDDRFPDRFPWLLHFNMAEVAQVERWRERFTDAVIASEKFWNGTASPLLCGRLWGELKDFLNRNPRNGIAA